MMKVEQKCKVIAKEWLTQDTVSMTLNVGDMLYHARTVAGQRIYPGQFVHIKCGDGLLLRRPISVCFWKGTAEEGTIRIVFEVKGEGTRWLARRPVGHTVDVLGPLGTGFQTTPGPYLLVGGGIGVPPLYACACYTGCSSTAILGFRSKDRAILLDEFDSECIDVKIATDDGSLGYHGFVDALVRQELEKEHHYQGILACGPKPMLKSVAKVAAEFNVPCQVSMEERMGCGVGACLVCATPMKDGSVKHVCKDGPVFNAREVDWDA